MALYAHALIEVPVDPEDASKGVTRYKRGVKVPNDLPGMDDLIEGGSVSEEQYDPAVDKSDAPEIVEIEGHRYIKVSDDAEEGTDADAR